MTEQKEYVKKPSYTERLLEQLKQDVPKVKKDVLQSIQNFASAQALLIVPDEDKDDTVVQFGKYNGKKFEDIYRIDHPYCLWLMKNKKYLRKGQIAVLESVITSMSLARERIAIAHGIKNE
jgi:hypothetical protein